MTAPQKSSFKFKFSRGAAAAGLAAVLVGCGGGSETTRAPKTPVEPPAPSPIDVGKKALNDALAAADGLPAGTDTATQLAAWQMVKTKAEELQAAVQSNNGSAADLMTATTALGNANTNITSLSQNITDIATANTALMTAMNAYNDLPATATDAEKLAAQEAIEAAANDLIMVLQGKGGSTTEIADATMKRDAADSKVKDLTLSIASADLTTALGNLDGTNPTTEQVNAVKKAVADLEGAIAHLSDSEKAGYNGRISDAKTTIMNAETTIANNNQNKTNEAVKKWITAIDTYDVGTVAALVTDLKGTSGLEVEVNDSGVTTIELDNAQGVPIPATSTISPTTGYTAKRFTETADKSRGVILTSRSKGADRTKQHSYTNYFYTSDTAGTLISPLPIAGVTPAANTGVLTFATTAVFRNNQFGGTRPTGFTTTNLTRGATFLNVPGTLTCSDTTNECSVNDNGDGTFSFGASVTFTPTIPQGKNLSDIILTAITFGSDTKYVSFGYWLTTTGSGNSIKHSIDTYAMGSAGYGALGTVGELRGSASYSGGAGGVYVLKTGDLQSTNPDLHQGEFVADVALKAQFGDSTGTMSDAAQWKITGTIDDFQSSTNTNHNLSAWSLGLSADLGERNPSTADTNPNLVNSPSFTLDKAITNGPSKAGSWIAQFYGNAGAGTTDNDDNYPEAVVGEFDGHFVNGHVVGAFGAEKD